MIALEWARRFFVKIKFNTKYYSTTYNRYPKHKRTSWGCRGCGRIPNTVKLTIIRAKILNIWANFSATFTFKWDSVYIAIVHVRG